MVDDLYDLDEICRALDVPRSLVEELAAFEVVTPNREGSSWRLTAIEVDRVRVAHDLIDVMEVNLAGVAVVLDLRERLLESRRQLAELTALIHRIADHDDR